MSNETKVQYGLNPRRERHRVLYTNTSGSTKTIYEGEPMCFNYDTTANLTGYSKSEGGEVDCQTDPNTTAEGYQNEGKYLRVENPNDLNLQWFAGVVAPGSWVGQTVANGASLFLELYAPNGAIVPVRSSVYSTVGQTLLAITDSSQTFSSPLYASSTSSCVVVAIAEETVDRSSTNGLCLAKLHSPEAMANLGVGVSSTTQLLVGTGTSSGTLIPFKMMVKSDQTGGDMSVLRVRGEAGGAGMNMGLGAIRAEGVVNANVAHTGSYDADVCAIAAHTIVKTGCTPAAGTNLTGGYFKFENQDATPGDVANSNVSAATFVLQNNDAPTLSTQMRFVNQGSDTPDAWFTADSAAAIAMQTADTTFTPHWGGSITIKVAGTTYHIPVLADLN